MSNSRMSAHVPRVHQHLVMVRRGVMGRHDMVVRRLRVMMLRLLVERTRSAMTKRGPVVVSLVGVRRVVMLALLARMRVLW